MFIGQISAELILFIMLYGGAAVAALIACLYLCQRKGNAFAADVTPPMRLRRWAAAFFAVAFLSHVWWYLFCIYSNDTRSVSFMVVSMLDCVGLLTTIAGTMLSMLQDRKRPVWPLVTAAIPFPALLALDIVYPAAHFQNIAIAYILLLYVIFTVYMIFAVRQYGRWLRDNYADLEHKEVWMSHVLATFILLFIITYGFDGGDTAISYLLQAIALVLFGLLLWRVETLPQLENTAMEQTSCPPTAETAQVIGMPHAAEGTQESDLPTQAQQPLVIPANIEQLLAERCVGTKLYLQHDLTVFQLAQAVGINRLYLSHYFSRQGMTYNAYINDLRINHFISLYREANAAGQSITAQELARDSGYRSYSTFSLAFKQRMGQSVTAWMRETAK